MTPLSEARMHLRKAGEFLEAARQNLGDGHPNAATSNAVLAGINAKDAICLRLTGLSSRSHNHNEAPDELGRSGKQGRELAPTLKRLVRLKSKSQYQTTSIANGEASNAVEWACKLVDAATEIVNT